jgi:hypothetical protein
MLNNGYGQHILWNYLLALNLPANYWKVKHYSYLERKHYSYNPIRNGSIIGDGFQSDGFGKTPYECPTYCPTASEQACNSFPCKESMRNVKVFFRANTSHRIFGSCSGRGNVIFFFLIVIIELPPFWTSNMCVSTKMQTFKFAGICKVN